MNPVAGRRDFQTERVHVAANELFRTGHGQTWLEFAHISGDEARKHALDRHAEMSSLQRQITAEFLDKCLPSIEKKTTVWITKNTFQKGSHEGVRMQDCVTDY